MEKNEIQKVYTSIKNILVYRPSTQPDPFVLDETEQDGKRKASDSLFPGLSEKFQQFETVLRYAKRLATFLEKYIEVLHNAQWCEESEQLQAEYAALEKQQTEINMIQLSYNTSAEINNDPPISVSLAENQKSIEKIYQLPLNKDVVLRKLTISAQPDVKAMVVFMDGLADKKIVNMTVLQPLMWMRNTLQELSSDDLVTAIIEQYLPSGQASRVASFKEVQQGINTGDTLLFLDGLREAVTIETKGFEHRGVDRPATEQSVRGSQNAFTEVLRVNTTLIRSMLHSSDLITEMIPVGKRGHSNCAVMYLKSVANQELVAEVRRRIQGINTDIIDSGMLENFIIDFPGNPFPQTLSTERPDRIVVHLAEGRVAILMDGSPFGHIVPVSIFTLMHAADDFALHYYYSNILRIIRWVGGFISMLLPATYLAISTFHQEAIPTELLLSITAARAQVPFPTFLEILLMEFSFELIREGGLRIPGILGSTLGIVGAIILGQAAVSAKIVSPIMVIVIAVTGLASYGIPDYRLSSAFRLLRLVFIVLSMSMGLVGMTCGFLVFTALLCSMKSFGMPYLAPVAPKTTPGGDIILRMPGHKQEKRPDELNPQDVNRQGIVSRPWTEETPIGRDDS